MVARALWRSEALRVVPWLRPCTRLVSDQGTTLRASDLHNARATILNPFISLLAIWCLRKVNKVSPLPTREIITIWFIAGLPVSFKGKGFFFSKDSFLQKKSLKRGFQYHDLAIKICRQMQTYSLWTGLFTWRPGFKQIFVFLGIFFLLENFCAGQDGAKWGDAPQRIVKGIKNGCPCIVEIRGTQGCALVGDPARAVP